MALGLPPWGLPETIITGTPISLSTSGAGDAGTLLSSIGTPYSPPSAPVADSCPIFYPRESRALSALATNGLPSQQSPIISPSSSAKFGSCSSGWPTEIGDELQVSALVSTGTQVVTFYGRTLSDNGQLTPFSRTVTANSATTPVTAILTMPQGCLLSIDAYAPSGLGSGNVFVLGRLGSTQGGTFIPYQQVLSGQLTGYGVAASTVTASGSASGGGSSECIITGGDVDFATGSASETISISSAPSGQFTRIVGVIFDLDTIACATDTQYQVIFRSATLSGWEVYTNPYVTKGLAQAGINVGISNTTRQLSTDVWYVQIPWPFALPGATSIIVQPSDGATNATISAGYVSYQYTNCCC